jgi:outer membrane lipoprotein-sorting protein
MLTFAALALTFLEPSTDSVFDRYKNFMKDATSFSVDLEVHADGSKDVGKGKFLISLPDRYSFSMKWGNEYNYRILLSPAGEFETEAAEKTYDQREFAGLGFPESRISPVPKAGFPTVLTLKDLRGWMTEGIEYKGTETIRGVSTDIVQAAIKEQSQSPVPPGYEPMNYLTAYIDNQGQLRRFVSETKVKEKSMRKVSFNFSNFVLNPTVAEKDFVFKIPTGYTPHALQREHYSLEIENPMPLGVWKNSQGGDVDLKTDLTGKPTLLVLTGDDPRMEPNVEGFLNQLKAKGLSLIHLSNAKTPPAGSLFDPTGKRFAEINPPGTPMFYLVDGKGAIKRLWYGYSLGESSSLLNEIVKARDALK